MYARAIMFLYEVRCFTLFFFSTSTNYEIAIQNVFDSTADLKEFVFVIRS